MHSTPEYRSKPEVKSCQMNGYCLLLRLKAECLLNNVKWVMNDSSMFSLIVWKMKCAFPLPLWTAKLETCNNLYETKTQVVLSPLAGD